MGNVLAVDIGGTKIRAGVFDGQKNQHIQAMATRKLSAVDFVDQLANFCEPLIAQYQVEKVGVASAGPVNTKTGFILNPANLGNGDQSWLRFDLRGNVEKRLTLPVRLDNDALCTAWGYFNFVNKKQCKNLVVVTLGTGLGVGAITNGEKARGGQHMHPELGHFIVADQPDNNHPTPFANLPTLESYLSGFHFSKRVGRALKQEITGLELIEISKNNFDSVQQYWSEYSQRMAIACTNLYIAYFPEKIVLAGGFAHVAAEFYLEETQQIFAQLMQARTQAGQPLPRIEVFENSSELPLLGAAALWETDN